MVPQSGFGGGGGGIGLGVCTELLHVDLVQYLLKIEPHFGGAAHPPDRALFSAWFVSFLL